MTSKTISQEIWLNLYYVVYNLILRDKVIKKIKRYNHVSRIVIAVVSSGAVVSVLASLAEGSTITIIFVQSFSFTMAIFVVIITYINFPEVIAVNSQTAQNYLKLEKDYIKIWQNWLDDDNDDNIRLKGAYEPLRSEHYKIKEEEYNQKNIFQFNLSDKEKRECQRLTNDKLTALGFL